MAKENDNFFEDIMEGLEQADAHFSGAKHRGRTTKIEFIPAKNYSASAVRRLRKDAGLTQEAFSVLLAVSLDTVKKWETGTPNIQPATRRLLQTFESDPDKFIQMFKKEA